MENLEEMEAEWQSWRIVCEELEAIGVSINDQEQLHAALVLWGETLAILRRTQDRNDCIEWFGQALKKAEAVLG